MKFIDWILVALDRNSNGECNAVLATLLDWQKAFPRIDHKIGINSFIKNGVRPALIPILISFCQNRRMVLKWHGKMSSEKKLPASAPQGSTIGILLYLSASNDNCDKVPVDDRFKFVDDASIIEVISLLNVGLASHNSKIHVSSQIPENGQFIPSEHLKTQKYVEDINNWTEENKMILNPKKTKNIIFNFSNNNQFTTNIKLKGENLEIVEEAKLLGTIITSDLKWKRNTEEIVKDANKRMRILHAAAKFTSKISDLKTIYYMFIRSKLEHSSVVWSSAITQEEKDDLERIQKAAVKVITGNKYEDYEEALKWLNMTTLDQRRQDFSLKFAKSCLKNDKVKHFFPLNIMNEKNTRNHEKYKVNFAHRKRYKNSTIPNMQRLLNKDEILKKKILRRFGL